MAKVTVLNNELVTTSATENEYIPVDGPNDTTCFITVVSSTSLKIGDQSIQGSKHNTSTAGDKLVLSCSPPNQRGIFAIGTGSFTITW